jgi:hypothetical protein
MLPLVGMINHVLGDRYSGLRFNNLEVCFVHALIE